MNSDPPPSSDRPLPSYQIDEERVQLMDAESMRVSRTSGMSLPPVTITMISSPTIPEDMLPERGAEMAKTESKDVLPADPPPPPPDKSVWLWPVVGLVVITITCIALAFR